MPIQVKALLVVLVAAMVALIIYVNNNAVTGPDEASFSKPSYVERLIPASGTNVLSQSTVGVDLTDGYDAFLVINGKQITNTVTKGDDDGLRKAPTLGTVEYDPGPGRRIPKLDSPRQCIDAWIWKKLDGPATAKQITWCFQVS